VACSAPFDLYRGPRCTLVRLPGVHAAPHAPCIAKIIPPSRSGCPALQPRRMLRITKGCVCTTMRAGAHPVAPIPQQSAPANRVTEGAEDGHGAAGCGRARPRQRRCRRRLFQIFHWFAPDTPDNTLTDSHAAATAGEGVRAPGRRERIFPPDVVRHEATSTCQSALATEGFVRVLCGCLQLRHRRRVYRWQWRRLGSTR
jgi:hypothetical protein